MNFLALDRTRKAHNQSLITPTSPISQYEKVPFNSPYSGNFGGLDTSGAT
jgi:hypothetical protein